ncbi:MAG: TolC family protein, partial [Nitrospira sp.]|nr:TolC family protein [Nitrospira sp.]
ELIRRQSLVEAEKATRRTVEVADDQYRAGENDFLTVLDAQRSLLTIQDQLAASNAQVTTNIIRLYKALGGGWATLAPEDVRESSLDEGHHNQSEGEKSGKQENRPH